MAKGKKNVVDGNNENSNVVEFDANAKTPLYKVGDWVYYAFELQQVKKLDEKGNVTELSDGNITLAPKEGQSLESDILPLSPQNKAASDTMKAVASEFSQYSAYARLNTPEVFQWLVARWHELSKAQTKEQQEAVANEINRLRQTILGVIGELQKIQFDGNPNVPDAKEGEVPIPSHKFQLFKV